MRFIKQGEIIHKHEVDDVRFFPYQEALEKITFKDDRKMLKKAKSLFNRH
jgi:hypothetical protein